MHRTHSLFDSVSQVPRRLPSGLTRTVAIAVAVVAACAIAVPATAHDGGKTLPPCSATLPLTTPCAPTVTPPSSPGGPYTITLPGVGTLSFTVDPATNTITSATVSGLAVNFTASTPKIDGDADKVTVTFTNTTDPTQVYRVRASVRAPATAGGAPTIFAKVGGRHHGDGEHHNHEHEHEGGGDH
jgi:hypothetical protein